MLLNFDYYIPRKCNLNSLKPIFFISLHIYMSLVESKMRRAWCKHMCFAIKFALFFETVQQIVQNVEIDFYELWRINNRVYFKLGTFLFYARLSNFVSRLMHIKTRRCHVLLSSNTARCSISDEKDNSTVGFARIQVLIVVSTYSRNLSEDILESLWVIANLWESVGVRRISEDSALRGRIPLESSKFAPETARLHGPFQWTCISSVNTRPNI